MMGDFKISLRPMIATNRSYRSEAWRMTVPAKATRILHVVLMALVLIFLRLWYLEVIQRDALTQAAQAPTRRVVVEPSRRATIRDRFGLPLAINKVQFNAAVTYSQIAYQVETDGKVVKRKKRREYIRQLAELLGTELNLDPDDLEDRIYAEAAFYDHAPYIVKKDISEPQYYRLKMLEASWPGLQAQRVPRRHYPYGKVAGDVVGYMGAIDSATYQTMVSERKALQAYVRAREAGEEPPLPEGVDSPDQARRGLRELEERAYTINDFVGKGGIERQFEHTLRGYIGKRRYYVDSKGNYLRELPGPRAPIPGSGVTLSLSVELQEFAEQLLAQNERIRATRVSKPDRENDEKLPSSKDHWIKGGAIVALDPNNGEVLALASYPRFDPNDFIPSGDPAVDGLRKANVRRWFETESYIGEIWDGKRSLWREVFDDSKQTFVEEEAPLTWDRYVGSMLYDDGQVKRGLLTVRDIEGAIVLQRAVERLVSVSGDGDLCYLLNLLYQGDGHQPQKCPLPAAERERIEANLNIAAEEVEAAKAVMDPYLTGVKHTYDKILLIDLCRVAVDSGSFSYELLRHVGSQSLACHRRLNQAYMCVKDVVHGMTRDLFHSTAFKEWRQTNEKAFLKEKRAQERLAGLYARPYTEYLDAKEDELFHAFWDEQASTLLLAFLKGSIDDAGDPFQQHFSVLHRELKDGAHRAAEWRENYLLLQKGLEGLDDPLATAYFRSMRSFSALNRPLYGRYRQLKWEQGRQLEKHLASAFYPTYGYGFGRSLAYRQAAPQGSIFKLVTAYAALAQRYTALKASGESLTHLNPLKIIDQPLRIGDEWIVGYTLDGKPIPQLYKGGLLPKTLNRNIGEIDVVRAIEVTSNSYFALLTSDFLSKPQDLADAAWDFSYGHRTGIDLPGEISGRVPMDLEYNRSGLYMLAIGQHSLVVTPLQTAVFLSSVVNGGTVFRPKIIRQIGIESRPGALFSGELSDSYRESLAVAGIDFPLFIHHGLRRREEGVVSVPSVIERQVFMPVPVRSLLLEGMHRVASRYQTKALWPLKELYERQPEAIYALVGLKDQLVGKTSTAESVENLGPDRQVGTLTYNHTWFGSAIFDPAGKEGQEIIFRDSFGKPELVVIVYLRYGAFGRDGVPLAAQIAAKWREIQQRELQNRKLVGIFSGVHAGSIL